MIKSNLVRVALAFYFSPLFLVGFAAQESKEKEIMMERVLEELTLAQNSMKEENLVQDSRANQVFGENGSDALEDATSKNITSDSKNWEISETFHYERSKLELTNVGAEIKLYEADTIIKRCFKKGSIALTIPYIYQKDNVRVTRSLLRAGQVVGISRESERSNEGLSEFSLDGVYYLYTEDEKNPVDFMLYSYVKFPTIDNDCGFGTSEYDAGPGLGLNKRLFDKWQISSDVYYIFIGDPPEQDLRNEFKFDGGFSYDLTLKITLSVTYEQSNALVKQVKSSYKDILMGINYRFNDSLSFFGEKVFELNNGYLEESITFGTAVRF